MKSIGSSSFLAFFLLVFLSNALVSQSRTDQSGYENKWVFGGDFGIGFSSYGANIIVSPQIGYRITPAWEAGTRITYNYYSYKDRLLKFSSSNYGGGFYTSYQIFRGLFAHAENELLSYQKVYINSMGTIENKERILIHSVFAGGGYRQYFSSKAFASIMILYNLNETLDSPYNNPLFRIGFGFGL
ncbi:MAG: hypothetical protein CVT92_00435 [Bacteroidetes bacterium HGW-Bacteroidetes-1]|jgi:hypothetical protein|nr:MAG: hypothetical protein CVT92_00435 [Bacteroidetes bacterium HGW-Bacteroidetes-1]